MKKTIGIIVISLLAITMLWPSLGQAADDSISPSIPTLNAPHYGTIVSDNDVHVDWNPSVDNIGVWRYELAYREISSDDWNTGLVSTSGAYIGPLDDGEYVWKVRAKDYANNASAYSDSWTFTVDTTAPAIPENLRAGDVVNNSVNLAWNEVGGATSYKVYKNNVYIARVTSVGFTDYSVGYGTFAYTVTALDNVRNMSGESEAIQITQSRSAAASDANYDGDDGNQDGDDGIDDGDTDLPWGDEGTLSGDEATEAAAADNAEETEDEGEVMGEEDEIDLADLLTGENQDVTDENQDGDDGEDFASPEATQNVEVTDGVVEDIQEEENIELESLDAEKNSFWKAWWFWLLLGIASIIIAFIIWYRQDNLDFTDDNDDFEGIDSTEKTTAFTDAKDKENNRKKLEKRGDKPKESPIDTSGNGDVEKMVDKMGEINDEN